MLATGLFIGIVVGFGLAFTPELTRNLRRHLRDPNKRAKLYVVKDVEHAKRTDHIVDSITTRVNSKP